MGARSDTGAYRLHEDTRQTLTSVGTAITVIAVMGFMLWTRIRQYRTLITADGTVEFASPDAWYHRRAVVYTVKHYPATLQFDPFTGFDTGKQAAQFGTVFDQLLATVALVIGGGSPTPHTVDLVLLFAPPVLGTLVTIPVYLLASHLTDSLGGIIATVVLALTPGLFLSRSMAGFADHHVLETLLVAISLFALAKLFSHGRDDSNLLRAVRNRNWALIKAPLRWALLSSLSLGLYLLTWPPGIFIIAIIGAFAILHLVCDHYHERPPATLALQVATVMIGASCITILRDPVRTLSVTNVSLAQVLVPLIVAGGSLTIAGLSAYWRAHKLPRNGFIVALVVFGVNTIGLLAIIAPDLLSFFTSSADRVFWFIGTADSGIAEARGPANPLRFGFGIYGFALVATLCGLGYILVQLLQGRDRPAEVLILVFSLFMLSATLSQRRFDYYLVISIATVTGYTVATLRTRLANGWGRSRLPADRLRTGIITAVAVFLIVGPLALSGISVGAAANYTDSDPVNGWDESYSWLRSETPEPGTYASPNGSPLKYQASYEPVKNFNYQNGTYGILTRWDKGHELTVKTRRIPVSNPHQQHATEAANILTAANESKAIGLMDANFNDGEGVRYVILDYYWGAASSPIYTNPAIFETEHDLSKQAIRTPIYDNTGTFRTGLHTERSYQSLRTRLYQFHGSAASPSRLTTHYTRSASGQQQTFIESDPVVRQHDSVSDARQAAATDPTAVHGGLYGEPPTRIPALQHFRLVHATSHTTALQPQDTPPTLRSHTPQTVSTVKTFERVPGATIRGQAPPGSTIRATVRLRITTTNETFTYTQFAIAEPNGTYTLTVPYATTGYGEYSTTNGYTNTSVRAEGPYTIAIVSNRTQDATVQSRNTVSIPEGAVLGEISHTYTIPLR